MVELEHHRNGMDSGMDFDLKSSVSSAKGRQENKKKQLLKQTLERGDNQVTDRNRFMEENQNFNDGNADKSYTRRKQQLLKAFESLEEQEDDKRGHLEERNTNGERAKRRKTVRNTKLSKEPDESVKEQDIDGENNLEVANPKFVEDKEDNGINKMEDKLPKELDEGEETVVDAVHPPEENIPISKDRKSDIRKLKMKKRLLEEAAKADQRGVCYLSRIPPHMDHVKLRQILSQYGEIQRIYLAAEGSASQAPRKRANRKRDGGFQEQGFSEGWVEFTKKSVAKRVANMLNGEQIGGRKRSSFYYDLWNIKYLSKFKWDDLTAEKAYKSAVREQKLALEMSAAKKERDFYLSKVDKSRALSAIEERLKKKQKVEQEAGTNSDVPISQQPLKVVRQFSQKRPVAGTAVEKKAGLSKDILAGVFGGS